MEREIIGIYGLLALFVLIMLRIPVALAMLVTGVVGTWVLSLASPFIKFGPYLLQFKTALWNSVANYDLSVVPLFVLMGFLAAETGLSRDLFQGLSALTQKIRGGVAMATVLACAGFGAVSGSSIATASTMSRVALPELRRLKYNEGLSTGVLGRRRYVGHFDPAVRGFGDLRDRRGSADHRDVPSGYRPRSFGSRVFPNRHTCASGPKP
jgi:TRAP-type mannitol/chloroaromatic compound transport system permease large subunit